METSSQQKTLGPRSLPSNARTCSIKRCASTASLRTPRNGTARRSEGCDPNSQFLGLSHSKETTMQLGMIGLGRMGGNMVLRLLRGGHECVAFDRDTKRTGEFDASE